MAIAHVCAGCGYSLTRVRATREAHYRLPVVVCPRCACACVRRRHPLWCWNRARLRAGSAVGVLALQLMIAAGLGALHLIAVPTVFATALDAVSIHGVEYSWWLLGPPLLVLPIVTGVWLTCGLSHLPRWRAWLGWGVFVGAVLTIAGLTAAFVAREVPIVGFPLHNQPIPERLRAVLLLLPFALAILVVMMVVADLGVPLGRMALAAHAAYRRGRFRRRRRRSRLH